MEDLKLIMLLLKLLMLKLLIKKNSEILLPLTGTKLKKNLTLKLQDGMLMLNRIKTLWLNLWLN